MLVYYIVSVLSPSKCPFLKRMTGNPITVKQQCVITSTIWQTTRHVRIMWSTFEMCLRQEKKRVCSRVVRLAHYDNKTYNISMASSPWKLNGMLVTLGSDKTINQMKKMHFNRLKYNTCSTYMYTSFKLCIYRSMFDFRYSAPKWVNLTLQCVNKSSQQTNHLTESY